MTASLWDKPRDGAVVDVVAPCDLPARLPGIPTTERLLGLMRRQLGRSPHLDGTRFRPGTSFTCPRPDQLALKFRKPTEDGEHQPAMSRCRVSPGITEGAK